MAGTKLRTLCIQQGQDQRFVNIANIVAGMGQHKRAANHFVWQVNYDGDGDGDGDDVLRG